MKRVIDDVFDPPILLQMGGGGGGMGKIYKT